jgi:ornithine cyclodeaminase
MLPALEHVVYRTSDGRRDLEFEACIADRCHVAPAANANDAVAASDVIVTATTGRAPLFDAAAISPGTHINAVGADTRGKRELPDGLLARALVWADDLAQARTLGELQWEAPDFPAAELGSLLSSPMPREAAAITVFDMTGTALQDLSVARMLYRQAQALSAGTVVPWPW